MSTQLSVPPAWLLTTAIATIFVLLYPLVLGVLARKKLAVSWKYFWFGALVFLVFQILTRVPLVTVLQNTVLAPLLRSSNVFVWTWLLILAITAGLFEEIGRYVGYRLCMRGEAKTWSKAVMFGLGHEGLESIALVGGAHVLTLINIAILSAANIASRPAAQRETILQQFAAINAQPIWLPLLSAWERLWSVPLQVMLSVIVLQVFRRHQIRWLGVAILLHAVIDFLDLALPQAFGSSTAISLLVEGILCVFGVIGIGVIWRLREPADPVNAGEAVTPL